MLLRRIGLSGGGERIAREVITRLDPERFERTLCVTRWQLDKEDPDSQSVVDRLEASGVGFLGLERRSRFDIRAWWPLLSSLRRGRVDVLHAHMFGSNFWAAILGTLARTPVVIAHEHTWSFEGQPLRKFIDRNVIARRADAFLAVSDEDRRRMIEIERIDPTKVVFVPNGIPPAPPPTGTDPRVELGIPPAAPVIGTVCTFRAQKALDVLVTAAAKLVESYPHLRVLIVGDGSERPNVETQIRDLGLEDTVLLPGRRTDIPDILRAFDVAVCSSDFEGTPLSILEYMEAGLPVVATSVGGVPALIESGTHGLLVEPRNPTVLASAVGELLDDPERAAEMGRSGRERRRREFGIDVTVRELERIYTALAAGATSASLQRRA